MKGFWELWGSVTESLELWGSFKGFSEFAVLVFERVPGILVFSVNGFLKLWGPFRGSGNFAVLLKGSWSFAVLLRGSGNFGVLLKIQGILVLFFRRVFGTLGFFLLKGSGNFAVLLKGSWNFGVHKKVLGILVFFKRILGILGLVYRGTIHSSIMELDLQKNIIRMVFLGPNSIMVVSLESLGSFEGF